MAEQSKTGVKQRWTQLGKQAKTTLEVVAGLATVAGLLGVWIGYEQLRQASDSSSAQLSAQQSAQARLVSASVMPGLDGLPIEMVHKKEVTEIALYNRSKTPVYHVIVSLVMVQGGGARSGLQLSHEDWSTMGADPYQDYFVDVPPGRYEATVSGYWGGMMARPGVEIAFTDDSGRNWIRSASGLLHAIPRTPADYYGLDEPLNWTVPPHSRY